MYELTCCPICGGKLRSEELRKVIVEYSRVLVDTEMEVLDDTDAQSTEVSSDIREFHYYCVNGHTEHEICEAVRLNPPGPAVTV